MPLALDGLAIGTTEFVMMGLLPSIAHDFRVVIPEVGYVIPAYALGVVIGAPLLTVLGRNLAPKRLLIILMLVFTVFNTLSAFAPNNTVLFFTRLLAGLPHGAFFGVGSVVASRLAEKGKQAQAISTMFAGLTIANLLTVPLGTYLGQHYSWRWAAWAGSACLRWWPCIFSCPPCPCSKPATGRRSWACSSAPKPGSLFC